MKYKIKGAGPAGLAAAIKLAQKGYSVDVFEKAYSPGGGIGSNIQAMRSYGSDEKILETFSNEGLKINKMHPIFKIKKYAPSLKFDMLYSKSTPIFYTFHRGKTKNSLDVQLVEQAEREGVNIHFGKSISLNNSNIIASGSGFDPVGVGYGSEFKGKLKDNETISFFFGDKDVPHGYGYIAPFGTDELTIAITSFRQSDFANLRKNFEMFIKNNPIVSELIDGFERVEDFAGFGHFNVPNTGIYNYKYFVGGAAGFVDPARGFGVKYALLSGLFAAEAITSNKDYDLLWKESFEEELIEGFGRRLLLDKLKIKDYEKFVKGEVKNIKQYVKVPHSFKKKLLTMQANAHLKSWRKNFDYSNLIDF